MGKAMLLGGAEPRVVFGIFAFRSEDSYREAAAKRERAIPVLLATVAGWDFAANKVGQGVPPAMREAVLLAANDLGAMAKMLSTANRN